MFSILQNKGGTKVNFNKVIDRTGTYCTQWDYVKDRFGEEHLLPFTISDTDFAIPETVSQAINERLKHPILGYTRWKHAHFRDAVQKWYQDRFELETNEAWILYSPSVIYSISQLIQMQSDTGNGVVVQTPAYDAFFKTITANERELVENPLHYENGSYSIDFADLEEKLADENNKILLLCSPHNPTGRVWTQDELEHIIALCQKYNVFIISDEIHMDVTRKGMKHHPILRYTQKNVALVTSASKTFNFPGLNFSYLLVPDESLRDAFEFALKNRDGLSSTSILGMEATIAAYNSSAEWTDSLNDYLDESIDLVRENLQKNCPEIKMVESEATYLLWLDISELGFSMDEIQDVLVHQEKVAIMDGAVYGGNGEDFLRLNIGCPKSKVEEGVKRLISGINILKENKQQKGSISFAKAALVLPDLPL